MRRLLPLFIIVIILNGIIAPQALAVKSQTFTIGATIPAIPGVNVPLATDETVKADYWGNDNQLVLIEEYSKKGNTEVILKTYIAL